MAEDAVIIRIGIQPTDRENAVGRVADFSLKQSVGRVWSGLGSLAGSFTGQSEKSTFDDSAGDEFIVNFSVDMISISNFDDLKKVIGDADLTEDRGQFRRPGIDTRKIRPFTGLKDYQNPVHKPDRVALLKVITLGEVDNDNARKILNQTTDFLLQRADEADSEKFQITETFGQPVVHFFDRRTRIFQYGGTLMNMENFQWANLMAARYDRFLRGTQLVRENARCYLAYDDVLREGYLVDFGLAPVANQFGTIPFRFSMIITNMFFLSPTVQFEIDREFDRELSLDSKVTDELPVVFSPPGLLSLGAQEKIKSEVFSETGELVALSGTFNVSKGSIDSPLSDPLAGLGLLDSPGGIFA